MGSQATVVIMKSLAAVLLFAAVFAGTQAFSLRQLIGTCVEECNILTQSCPAGQVCRSNGCGHTCQPASAGISGCHFMMACALYCPAGFARDANGCTLCSCEPSLFDFFPSVD